MRFIFLFVLFCWEGIVVWGQQEERIMFYNVENLFDTTDEPLKLDDEFTPQGKKHWTRSRYLKKIKKLAQAVKVVGGEQLPLVIGLTEIENRNVLNDLTTKTLLVEGDYGIVHQDGPDPRGIDVALLYRRNKIQLLTADFYPVFFPKDTTLRTRDVLYTKMLFQEDTLHFFVCHFPSMIGGEKQSEWKRCGVASLVRSKVDSLFQKDPETKIVIMGDLNGKANTLAQKKILKTMDATEKWRTGELYNTGYYLLKKNTIGTYRYQGRWQTIDHIIVSSGLLNGKTGCQTNRYMQICSENFLLEEEERYFGHKPCPTYRGPRYIGGTSDRLPIYLTLYY